MGMDVKSSKAKISRYSFHWNGKHSLAALAYQTYLTPLLYSSSSLIHTVAPCTCTESRVRGATAIQPTPYSRWRELNGVQLVAANASRRLEIEERARAPLAPLARALTMSNR